MICELRLGEHCFRVDFAAGTDISRPVRMGTEGVAFSLAGAVEEPVTAGDFVGKVAAGGSVNCSTLHLNAHGNGTHTECIGHVLKDRVVVPDAPPPPLLSCVLLSAQPILRKDTPETYTGKQGDDDRVVTAAGLAESMLRIGKLPFAAAAVVVRTGLGQAMFSGANPPYFTLEAIDFLLSLQAEHLLCDLPSLDREDDGGALCAHRRFWGLAPDRTQVSSTSAIHRTVTELCHVPNELEDGPYLLSLQVPAVDSDAVPSRPLLFTLHGI